jgi:hypothetical protein
MPNIAVPPDYIAVFNLASISATGAAKPAPGTITVDNYAFACICAQGGGYVLVTKQIPTPGTVVNVTVTANATNSKGDALTPFVQTFALAGPVDNDPATHFALANLVVRDKIGYPVPSDQGQTIPLT